MHKQVLLQVKTRDYDSEQITNYEYGGLALWQLFRQRCQLRHEYFRQWVCHQPEATSRYYNVYV